MVNAVDCIPKRLLLPLISMSSASFPCATIHVLCSRLSSLLHLYPPPLLSLQSLAASAVEPLCSHPLTDTRMHACMQWQRPWQRALLMICLLTFFTLSLSLSFLSSLFSVFPNNASSLSLSLHLLLLSTPAAVLLNHYTDTRTHTNTQRAHLSLCFLSCLLDTNSLLL